MRGLVLAFVALTLSLAIAFGVALLMSCSSSSRPACSPAEREAIETEKRAVEAELFAEGFALCVGRTLENCPEFEAVRERYVPRREAAWKASAACP